MQVRFTKMQGLGNDFAVIDATTEPFALNAFQIKAMADRRLGVGFDQLLVLSAATSPDSDFDYHIFNADGSEAEQCGNGARCMARFIQKHHLPTQSPIRLNTPAGSIALAFESTGDVKVDMGVPAKNSDLNQEIEVGDTRIRFEFVRVGNPHAVIRVEDIHRAAVEPIGSAFAQHAQFPDGVNVGFVQVLHPAHLQLRVYERGVGQTQACGSGACAAMIAAKRAGWLAADIVCVSQPGGDLQVAWLGEGESVWMTGPATFVYEGQYDI